MSIAKSDHNVIFFRVPNKSITPKSISTIQTKIAIYNAKGSKEEPLEIWLFRHGSSDPFPGLDLSGEFLQRVIRDHIGQQQFEIVGVALDQDSQQTPAPLARMEHPARISK